jgi:hypothetical protein
MKRLLVLVAVMVVAVCADHHTMPADASHPTPADDAHDHTVDFEKLDDRIDHLIDRFHDLNMKIDARIDPARMRKAHSLEERVVRLEGNGCEPKEFQCGTDNPQCIGRILVCDGIKDCRNGHDEEYCELHLNVNDYFEGHVISDTCTKRQPDVISFEVKAVRRDPYFNNVAFMRILMHIEFEDKLRSGKVSLPTIAYYNFGSKKLIVMPPEDDRLGMSCEFDGYNLDRCKGEIKHEASLEVCATLLFTRKKDHDDHHEHTGEHHDSHHGHH